jgi:cytochrome c553
MPRLAGQQPDYIEEQLKAFSEGRRAGRFMGNVSRALKLEMIKALSISFQSLDPAALGGSPKELVSQGKDIYENGVQSANIPPCATCHGPQAKGDGQIPRLAGQLNDYIFKTLSNWKNERRQKPADPNASAILHPTAQQLTAHQIDAIAAYVSQLK